MGRGLTEGSAGPGSFQAKLILGSIGVTARRGTSIDQEWLHNPSEGLDSSVRQSGRKIGKLLRCRVRGDIFVGRRGWWQQLGGSKTSLDQTDNRVVGIQLPGDLQLLLGGRLKAVALAPLCQFGMVLRLAMPYPRSSEIIGFREVPANDLNGVQRNEDASRGQNDKITIVNPGDLALNYLPTQEDQNRLVLLAVIRWTGCLGA